MIALTGFVFTACNKDTKGTEGSKTAVKAAVAAPAKAAATAPAKAAAAEPTKAAAAEPAKAAAPSGKTTGSVVGKYVIDKVAVKKQMVDAIAKMPKDKRNMATMMLKFIDQMEMEVTLKEGGVVAIKETPPSFGKKAKPEVKEKAGKWEMVDGKVKISTSEKKTIICDVLADKLTCSKGKAGPFKMVLKRA